jgi:hypothetical protein
VKLNIVPARTGIQWVKLGIQTFLKQPLALAGLFFMFFMAFVLLSSLPLIGPIIAVVLMPGATLGMMAATEQAVEGRFPMPSVLLSAFRAGRQRAKAMLILGVVYAVVLLVLVLLVSPFTEATPPAVDTAATPAEVDAAMAQARPGIVAYMILQLPFIVLFAQAPALVHWYGVSPMKSLFFSAIALWRNLGAFIMFGLTWFVVLLGVGLVISLLFSIFGAAPTFQAMIPIALFVMAMMSTSMYFTFRDSFVATPEEQPPPGEDSP